VRENRPPGSVRGAPGNRRPYRDRIQKWSLAIEEPRSVTPAHRESRSSQRRSSGGPGCRNNQSLRSAGAVPQDHIVHRRHSRDAPSFHSGELLRQSPRLRSLKGCRPAGRGVHPQTERVPARKDCCFGRPDDRRTPPCQAGAVVGKSGPGARRPPRREGFAR